MKHEKIMRDEDFRYWLVKNGLTPGYFFALADEDAIDFYRRQYLRAKKEGLAR